MIRPGWRVLDVGSGDQPFPFATVLIDRTPRKEVAHGRTRTENPTASIVQQGKPFVVGELEALPFEEGSFDFLYASHVLEHVTDPARALSEMARVAARGYIECPRAWMEFVDGSPFHRWLIDFAGGELQFRPKTEIEAGFIDTRRLFDHDRSLFSRFYGQVLGIGDREGSSLEKSLCHVCVYWEGAIPFRLLPASTYRSEVTG